MNRKFGLILISIFFIMYIALISSEAYIPSVNLDSNNGSMNISNENTDIFNDYKLYYGEDKTVSIMKCNVSHNFQGITNASVLIDTKSLNFSSTILNFNNISRQINKKCRNWSF
ncbi:MAG: hypothetical protein GF329_06670 [Candidatus Lokiarchaeota archaeon]|nr:hypothetical protein [Candidatus Lokiarchaeota archaeon]